MTNDCPCALDIIYRCRALDVVSNNIVAKTRYELGMELANRIPNDIKQEIDFVTPCPNTGNYYAMGLATAINKPYLQAIYKNINNQRFFDIKDINERKYFLSTKLIPIKEFVENKNIAIVDEAIFSGMTLKILVELVKIAGAKKVFLCIPSAPCWKTCEYGKQNGRVVLLEQINQSMILDYFSADGVFFQEESIFKKFLERHNSTGQMCFKCFEEKYV